MIQALFNMFSRRRRVNSNVPATSTPKCRCTTESSQKISKTKLQNLQKPRSKSICVEKIVKCLAQKPKSSPKSSPTPKQKPAGVQKAKTKQRRASVTTVKTTEKTKVVTKRSTNSREISEENTAYKTIFGQLEKLSICDEKNLPKNSFVTNELFVKASFPEHVKVTKEGKTSSTIINFESQSGMIHLAPKSTLGDKRVGAERSLVSVVIVFEKRVCESIEF